jgi:hypothetical protein
MQHSFMTVIHVGMSIVVETQNVWSDVPQLFTSNALPPHVTTVVSSSHSTHPTQQCVQFS